MKKILSVLITFVLFTLICSTAFAENSSCSTIIEHFPDGSYLVTTITEQQSSTYVASTRTTKNGSKTLSYYNEDNEVVWSATVHGIFSYNGSSSTCTDASITYTINNSVWRITSTNAYASGNSAIGEVTAKKYSIAVIPIQTIERTVTLTCSPTGVLS